ncbi:MAG: NAD(P)/FAD-dependent oxidoreductase [Solirubrobacterales bacterium]|nr:NAD(P)/FAD-dependent oxidoreductase [Solirubrobacterales bacterium]
MPTRATKRGAQRTPLDASPDVVVCGASFAGLAVARELTGSGANVLLLDRYEIGERATSACAAPTAWLEGLGLDAAVQQTFGELVVHAADGRTFRWPLPFTFSTFDYRTLCAELHAQGDATFETATVTGRTGDTVHTDRGDVRAPLVVDALGWRRILGGGLVQPPAARLSRGLEVHPRASGEDLELWLDPRYARAGYAWAFPAAGELRAGVGSFEPRDHVKEPTLRLAGDVGVPAERFQGNWIPHQLRPAVEDGVFFVGDSAGHCLPTTAEGIRPALHFGLALGRELRAVVVGQRTREDALTRYAAFSASHARAYGGLLRVQGLVGRVNPTPLMPHVLRAMTNRRFLRFGFGHYRDICPPEAATPAPVAGATRVAAA